MQIVVIGFKDISFLRSPAVNWLNLTGAFLIDGIEIVEMHSFGGDYAKTLSCWQERLAKQNYLLKSWASMRVFN